MAVTAELIREIEKKNHELSMQLGQLLKLSRDLQDYFRRLKDTASEQK